MEGGSAGLFEATDENGNTEAKREAQGLSKFLPPVSDAAHVPRPHSRWSSPSLYWPEVGFLSARDGSTCQDLKESKQQIKG